MELNEANVLKRQNAMSTIYQIRVRGQLSHQYSMWFDGFTVSHTPNGDTLLTGAIIDQAALYGVLAGCRDLGLTLVSINPVNQHKENLMRKIIAESSRVINARPDQIYAIFADYRVSHPAIVPKPYFEVEVEKGGYGAGTVIWTRVTVMGHTDTYHQLVTEPEQGRVLVETDIDTGQFSSFTLDPLNGGTQTRVTIHCEIPAQPGLMGLISQLFNPPVMRNLFKTELNNVAEYVRHKALVANAS